jgi:Thaumatin family
MQLDARRNADSLGEVRVRTATPLAIGRDKRRVVNRILLVALLAFGFSSLFQTLWTISVHAQAGPDSCLNGLPTPQLKPGLHRVVQLVNCAQQTLLGTANAAQQKGKNPLPVLPREGTWLMGPKGSGTNVLTIDIPLEWEDTKCPENAHGMCQGIIGPRFWARTGCRYDLGFDKAQCETGGCGGRYDCSAARLANTVGTTVSEWTFNEPVSSLAPPPISYFKDSPDISAVDGANLNMDIEPLGGDPHDPFDKPPSGPDEGKMGHDIQWLAEQYPLTAHGQDVRASCAPAPFQLTRSTLTTGNPIGFVYVNKDGAPIDTDGTVDNSTVACFSNCGRYAFPVPPLINCTPTPGSLCYYWKSFCLGDPSQYGQPCQTDSDCPVNGACWDNPGSTLNHTCQGRAFVKNQACLPHADGSPSSNCPYVTYQYGYVDPVTGIKYLSTQPPLGSCSGVSTDPDTCIGDDTLHKVMPKVYTWPNDPQVYGGDSPAYRVIFAPGGIGTGAKITELSTIPFCEDLPGKEDVYGLSKNLRDCKVPIDYGALFALARPKPTSWGCDLDPTGAGDEAVICKWKSPAKVKQIGLRANFNLAGSNLQLSVLPASLLRAGDLLLASITFNTSATPTVPSGWTQVPGASVVSNSNNQTVVWYHFVSDPKAEPASYMWSWNKIASPSGGITAWRGVNSTDPFDATASVNEGIGATATAPSITTHTAYAQLLSVFGAGNANGQTFGLPVSTSVGLDETGALKVFGGPVSGTYYAHLVADRIESRPVATDTQSVQITSNTVPPDPNIAKSDWTAISFALKPM